MPLCESCDLKKKNKHFWVDKDFNVHPCHECQICNAEKKWYVEGD